MARNTAPLGPTTTVERALAPDLARGFMLLFIALANTVWYLEAAPNTGITEHPTPQGALDHVVQFFTVMAVDMRSYPMFAFLFGYGMVQLAGRQEAAGADAKSADALLRRRNLWLLVFGFLHALLLWMGDVLGAYGMVGLILGWLFFRRRSGTLLVWGAVLTGLLALLSVITLLLLPILGEVGMDDQDVLITTTDVVETSILSAAVMRMLAWPLSVGQGLLIPALPAAVLLGFWAARRRILEEPERNLPLLRGVAIVGVTVGWLGGLPLALAQTGVWGLSPVQGQALVIPHMLTGLFCGLGYVALIALVAYRIQGRGRTRGVLVTALSATGKRSLSAYLAQSVLCAPLLTAWGLGLAAHMSSWTMFLYAVGVWLLTVVGAYALERTGRRGPAEVLLRRLAYRRTTRTVAPVTDGNEEAPQEHTTR